MAYPVRLSLTCPRGMRRGVRRPVRNALRVRLRSAMPVGVALASSMPITVCLGRSNRVRAPLPPGFRDAVACGSAVASPEAIACSLAESIAGALVVPFVSASRNRSPAYFPVITSSCS